MIIVDAMRGRTIAVMGLGRSGLATAKALVASGASVLAWDDSAAKRAEAEAAGVPIVDLTACALDGLAALVLSPGIPHTHPAPHPVAARARAAGVAIIGDIELLALAQPGGRTLGVTGTNGKSTTTALLGHILDHAGHRVGVGGNLGTPALSLDPVGADGTFVLELSSYQLELVQSLTFDVAVLLNISPDHLGRHGGMDGYLAAKARIFDRHTRPQVAVVGIDDAWSRSIRDRLAADARRTVVPISAERRVPGGISAPDGILHDDTGEDVGEPIDLRGMPALPGRHNWQNAAAAYAAARASDVPPGVIAAALASFPGLAHRQALVADIDGVRFVNDSKATNADAAAKALACYDPIYWIVGGQAKEGGLAGLEGFMARVRHAFLIGEAADLFAAWLDGKAAYSRCGDLATAVPQAAALALAEGRPGATVLLSPACASWDQFADFEHRGETFAALVRSLGARAATGAGEARLRAGGAAP